MLRSRIFLFLRKNADIAEPKASEAHTTGDAQTAARDSASVAEEAAVAPAADDAENAAGFDKPGIEQDIKTAQDSTNESANERNIVPSNEQDNGQDSEQGNKPVNDAADPRIEKETDGSFVPRSSAAVAAQHQEQGGSGAASAALKPDDATTEHSDPAVDLSGELFSKDATLEAPASPTQTEINQQAGTTVVPAKKKRGFRAAWGAIRELLK